MDSTLFLPLIITAAVAVAGLVWKIIIQGNVIKTGNETIDAIVKAGQDQAIASDCYMRITSDGILTVSEEEEHRKKAAIANVSLLYAIEKVTGKQIYNRPEVPLPLPLGGKRVSDQPQGQPTEQPILVTPAPIPTGGTSA